MQLNADCAAPFLKAPNRYVARTGTSVEMLQGVKFGTHHVGSCRGRMIGFEPETYGHNQIIELVG